MAGAPKGNQNAVKLKTSEIKLEAYRQYCTHIAAGYPLECWDFDHPDLSITWETMEKYISEDPIVFPPIQKAKAKCKSYKGWFEVVAASAKGENEKANTATLQMIMRNKFKWDKEEKVQNAAETDVRAFLRQVEEKK